jgi:uncharacterized membrane protein (UPF0127 family)
LGQKSISNHSTLFRTIVLAALLFLTIFGIKWGTEVAHRWGLYEISFELPGGQVVGPYYLRLALNEQQRAQGLMYVPENELSGNRGMLFVFPEERDHSFWMRNTPAALDMIFVNRSGMVEGVVERTEPYSSQGRSIGVPSLYVIELLAGTASRDGLSKGARLLTKKPLPEAR